MEKEPTLEDALENIDILNPNAGEYLRIFLEMTADFDVEPYLSNPELGIHCFTNGLEDDINELMGLLSQDVSTDYIDKLKTALMQVYEMLHNNAFSRYALKDIFDRYLVRIPADEKKISTEKHRHYYVENIIKDQLDTEKFLSACGLTQETIAGKGSHTKWFDINGKFVQTS